MFDFALLVTSDCETFKMVLKSLRYNIIKLETLCLTVF